MSPQELRDKINTGDITVEMILGEMAVRGYAMVKAWNQFYQCGRCHKPAWPENKNESSGQNVWA